MTDGQIIGYCAGVTAACYAGVLLWLMLSPNRRRMPRKDLA